MTAPTRDERREVAERLREHDGNAYADVADMCDEDLADLIDPTCEMKNIPESGYRVCSRCGAFVRRDAVTSCTEAIPVRYCPNCGARVVSD